MALAARARALRPPPPANSTGQRLRREFAQYRGTPPPPALVRWLRRWAGFGPAPRPLVERLAAGALLLSALGGGAGVTAEGGWQDAYSLARNIVANLTPGDGPAGDPPLATVSPSPAPTTPAPATTPTPAATPSPTAVPAGADPTTEPGDDNGGSDNSGPGSGNSGRGGGTVEPGDDNGGSRPAGTSGDSSGSED